MGKISKLNWEENSLKTQALKHYMTPNFATPFYCSPHIPKNISQILKNVVVFTLNLRPMDQIRASPKAQNHSNGSLCYSKLFLCSHRRAEKKTKHK